MYKNRHFLHRTFGSGWKWKFFLFIGLSLFLASLPTLFFAGNIEFNIPKFCEEWLKNILSLSAIFIIVNYLNYFVGINRSKDKISMLIANFSIVGDGIFEKLSHNPYSKAEVNNLIDILSSLIKKIQNEDEFLYKVEGLSGFTSYENYFSKLKNHVSGSTLTETQVTTLKNDFEMIKIYLNNYL